MKNVLLLLAACLLATGVLAQPKAVKLAQSHSPTPVFVPNVGQWPGAFTLKTHLPGAATAAFFSGGLWTFVQRPPVDHTNLRTPEMRAKLAAWPLAHAWQMEFVASNKNAKADTLGSSSYKAHYLQGREAYHTSPTAEGQITDLYPGIDVHLIFAQQNLRFDFLVAPGADPSLIRFRYNGLDSKLSEGLLVLQNSYGYIYQTVPKAYQVINGDTVWVVVRYQNKGEEIGVAIGQYDKTKPLTIDPTLIFSTYSGAVSTNWGSTATYGEDGSMFSGGTIFDVGLPATVGAIDTGFNGTADGAILKYSPDGHRLLWATYFGGSSADDPVSMDATKTGELYIMAITGSKNYPMTPNGADTSFGGGSFVDPLGDGPGYLYFKNGSDLAISKLSADGSTLLGSTFIGGSGIDGLLKTPDSSLLHRNYGDCFRGEIILDATGHPCITSHSLSNTLSFTKAVQSVGQTRPDGQAIALRLSANLDTVYNKIAFGGSGIEGAYGLEQDSLGRTFVCGGTASNNFPASAGAYQTQYKGNVDGFLVRIAKDWSKIEAATYLGTSAYDQGYLVQVDNLGRPVVFGQTSGNYPRSAGVWTQGNAGGQFLHGLSSDLTKTVFSTAYGGPTPNLVITAFLIDVCNQLYVAGWGGQVNQGTGYLGGNTDSLPTTAGALQTTTDGSDFHILVLNPQASGISYGTFYGANGSIGDHVDGGTSRFDKRSIVYEAVCSCGGSLFPVTPGAYGPTNNSFCNNAAFKFDFSPLRAGLKVKSTSGCAPFTLEAINLSKYATEFSWAFDTLGNSTSTDTVVSYTFTKPGTYYVKLRAYNTVNCLRKDSAQVAITVNGFAPRPKSIDSTFFLCSLGKQVPLNVRVPIEAKRISWSPSTYLSDSNAAAPTATPTGSIAYKIKYGDGKGCLDSARVRLIDHSFDVKTNLNDSARCDSLAYPLQASVYPSGHLRWTINGTLADTTLQYTLVLRKPGTYQVRFVAMNDSTCVRQVVDTATFQINALANGRPPADTTYSLCGTPDTIALRTPLPPGHFGALWHPGASLSDSTALNPIARVGASIAYTVLLTDSNGCGAVRHVRLVDRQLRLFSNLADSSVCLSYQKFVRASGTPGSSYSWFLDGAPVYLQSDVPLTIFDSGRHRLSVVALNDSTCQKQVEDTAFIYVNRPRPTSLYQDTTLAVCKGDTLNLKAPEAGQGFRYQWTALSGTPSLSFVDSLPTLVVRNAEAGQIIKFVLKQNECENTRTISLSQDTLTATYASELTYDSCYNQYSLRLVGTNPTVSHYVFGEGATAITLGPTLPYKETFEGTSTSYSISIEAKRRGCSARQTYQTLARDASFHPKASFYTFSQYKDCNQPALITLFAASSLNGSPSYKLDGQPLQGLSFQLPDSLAHEVIQIVRQGPCLDTARLVIRHPLLQIPNIVTPNGDGLNDALQLPPSDVRWALHIWNRWGRTMANYEPYADLAFPGDLQAGTYFFTLTGGGLSSGCTGWIEVVRD